MTFKRARLLSLLLGLIALLSVTYVMGQDLIIYPSQGQSEQQQSRDRSECHAWSVQQAGFDPTAPQAPQTPPPTQSAPQGGALRGGAGGAAIGAVGGAIAGNAGKGAAIGAASGALLGGIHRSNQKAQQRQAQADWAAQQQAATEQGRATYNRALRACLTGRGYTVQ